MKLKQRIKLDKNLIIFLLILLVIGIIVGSLFVTLLSNEDQGIVSNYLTSFINKITNNELDYLFTLKSSLISDILFVITIWLLGISIIGLPIIIIMYFSKVFILGFSIGSILFKYHFKGILLALVYSIGQAIMIIGLSLLMIYAMSFSFKLIDSIFKKKTLNFKLLINKYLFVLAIVLVLVVIVSLYDTYIVPLLFKYLISLLNVV